MNKTEEWFETWFESPYYHTLYCNRNPDEARAFLENFDQKIGIRAGSTVLDLACGSGRHSRILHDMGLKVFGVDLSSSNITRALNESPPGIQFFVGDMRNFNLETRFDYIFNLFTSFGYFQNFDENLQVLVNCRHHLADGGMLVIDYFNSDFVRNNIAEFEHIEKNGLSFTIHRMIKNDMVIKEIEVKDETVSRHFSEKVRLIDLPQFQLMALDSGFEICATFGSYSLDPYNPLESERLILVLKKSPKHD